MNAPQPDRIYLDHAATTPLHPDVLAAMLPHLQATSGNPSSIYREGREARDALDDARETVAGLMRADPGEIVFTGSGSEGANLAVKGAAWAARREGRAHLVTTAIEHHCVLHTVQYLERQHGFSATYVPVDSEGRVDADAVVGAVRDDTALVSVMYANNEVGTIQPVAQIGAALAGRPTLLHTDAVQAAGSLRLDVEELGVDLLSIAAHKIYGPKGVGAVFVRRGTRVVPRILGGSQERDRRAGTENVAYAVGLAAALSLAETDRERSNESNARLTRTLVEGIDDLPRARRNGPRAGGLPNIVNVCIADVDSEGLLLELDAAGIAASSGSACTSASLEPSHVLLAMGVPAEIARSSLRLSTGRSNTEDQMHRVAAALAGIVVKLRGPSAVAAGGRVV